jgi:ABC-type transporter Mla MlaB component
MLRITLTERASGLTLSLEGKVSGPWVTELAQAWVQARERAAQAEITLDLRQVSFIDEPGRELLVRLHREGCRMVGSGAYVGPMVQAIQNGREAGWSPLRWCWMTALGMAAAAAAAAAPDPGPAPAPLSLTLPQAVRLGLDQNPDVHQALLAIAHSQEERRGAASALMPAVEASATGNRYKLNLDTLIGTATPGGPHVAGPYTYGSIGVQASAPLLDLSLWQRWKAAKDGELSAQARAKAQKDLARLLMRLPATRRAALTKSMMELRQALANLWRGTPQRIL